MTDIKDKLLSIITNDIDSMASQTAELTSAQAFKIIGYFNALNNSDRLNSDYLSGMTEAEEIEAATRALDAMKKHQKKLVKDADVQEDSKNENV